MLKISREDVFRDKLRSYKIIIDDTYCGNINSGETKILEVAPGKHTIYLKIDWCRSNKIDFYISENETIEFRCGNSMNGWRILFPLIYITFLKNKYLWINRV
jgi:hypothetical protein